MIIAGLGNPGPRYEKTRHNLGFLVADELLRLLGYKGKLSLRWNALFAYLEVTRSQAEKILGKEKLERSGFNSRKLLILKPQTFMNLSGRAVVRAKLHHPDVPILVICDDVNLQFGELRIRFRGRAGGHKGLESIICELGTDEFMRIRIGVGGGELPDVTDYVLEPMNELEFRQAEVFARSAAIKALEVAFLGYELASSFPFNS